MARAARPHPVDRHVGLAIRLRRRALGMSQAALAGRLGLSFQQVQKYERGANRVSASMLHGVAGALGVGVGALFDGLPATSSDGEGADPARTLIARMLAAPGGAELAAAWLATPSRQVRARLVALAQAIGEGQ